MNFLTEIDSLTHEFNSAFDKLNSEQLNFKPNANSWSIAQILAHLIRINESYYPAFEEIKNGTYKTPFTAKVGFLVNFFGNFILKSVLPEKRKKTQTFPVWQPQKSNYESNIIKEFEDSQETLKNYYRSMTPYIQKGQVISSPANKYIVYSLERAFEIILNHEKRHFLQAKEVKDILKKSGQSID